MADVASLPLVLASGSPRRRELLAKMGVKFEVHVTNMDETRLLSEEPKEFVMRVAQDKARTAQNTLAEEVAILAADTVVVMDDQVFAKPHDYKDAVRIWTQLSDRQHQVMTAICLAGNGRFERRLSITDVRFGAITETQMQQYWASGEPQDKAGAYAIQGLASAWVQLINGSYSNVVGLPLREVNELLKTLNKNWL